MDIAFYRTHHSYSEGSCTVKSCVAKAADSSIGALVMADRTVLSDGINHYRHCRGAGIEPVMGLLLSIYDEKEISDSQVNDNTSVFNAICLIYAGLFDERLIRPTLYPVFSELEGRFIAEVKKQASSSKPMTALSLYKSAFIMLQIFADVFKKKCVINNEFASQISTLTKRSKSDFMFGDEFDDICTSENPFDELLNIAFADSFACKKLKMECVIDPVVLQDSVLLVVDALNLNLKKTLTVNKFLKSTCSLLDKVIPELKEISVNSDYHAKPPAKLITGLKKIAKDALCIFNYLQECYQTNDLAKKIFSAVVEQGGLYSDKSYKRHSVNMGRKALSACEYINSAYNEYQYLITERSFVRVPHMSPLFNKYVAVFVFVRSQGVFSNYVEKNESIYPDLTVIAKNQMGWANLIRLSSLAFLNGQNKGMITLDKDKRASNSYPKTTMSTLTEHAGGLVAVLGLENDSLWKAIVSSGDVNAVLNKYIALFGSENILIPIQHSNSERDGSRLVTEGKVNSRLIELSKEYNLVAFAMNNAYFEDEHDYEMHEAKSAIGLGELTQSHNRNIVFGRGNFLRTSDEMHIAFSETPELINNTQKLAGHLGITGEHLHIELDQPSLPDFPVPTGFDIDSWILKLATDGVEEKFSLRIKHQFGTDDSSELKEEQKQSVAALKDRYMGRLDTELKIIRDMGFNGYFLIVAEFIAWSKGNGVPVGHGRGSGAGSIVAWGLDITDVDPIRYNLLFERFLNPERVSMPDFDVDFGAGYHPVTGEFMTRDSVIRHVQDLYNHKGEVFPSVGQIATHGLFSPKSAFKALCRTDCKNVPYSNDFAKLVGDDPSQQKIKYCLENSLLMQRAEREPYLRYLLDMGGQLEGMKQNTGIHAGGVVIAKGTMVDHTPVMIDIREPTKIIAQFDKYGVEEAGLVKFDFLGVYFLTIMEIAKKYISDNTGVTVDLRTLSYEDEKVFDLLKSGNSHGIFQVESEGMRKLLQSILCEDMEELSALLALYRPGPIQSGMVDNFIARKHGREVVSYPDAKWQHECLKPILEPTYGIILYQEQVMQIAQFLAGYTLGGADMLRRAMGKKKPEEMAKQREVFERGAINNGVDGELAMKIFDLVEKFAGYGFNKSHSMAYAHITYQSAWLKTYYPTEYMSALLTSFMTDQEKLKPTIIDCKRNGIQVLQPSINNSHTDFRPVGNGVISFGLAGIKGIGRDKLDAIIAERESNGKFKSILDLRLRCPKNFDTRVGEGLLYSGALDDLETFHDCTCKLRNVVDVMGGSLSSKDIEQNRGMLSSGSFSLGEINSRVQEIYNEILEVLEKFQAEGFSERLVKQGIGKDDRLYPVKAGCEMIRHINDLIASGASISTAWDLYVDIVSSLLDDRTKLLAGYKKHRKEVDSAKADIKKLESEKIEMLREKNELASFDKRAYLLKDIGAIVGQPKPLLMVLNEYKDSLVNCESTSDIDGVALADLKSLEKCKAIIKTIDYDQLKPFADGFRLSRELTYLTYYITGHPFDVDDRRRKTADAFENTPITYITVPTLVVEDGIEDEEELSKAKAMNRNIKKNTPEIRVAGIIVESRRFKVKKDGKNQGKEMCILKIDDSTSTMTIVVLPDALACCKGSVSNGSVFACEGQVFYDMFRDDGSISMLPNKIYNANEVTEVIYENERNMSHR